MDTNNHLSVEEILKNGEQWNEDWINTAGSNHWLASCWKLVHESHTMFVVTCCEVTAAAIRWKSGLGDEWSCLDGDHKFEEVEKKFRIFQISIGEDWTDCQHILTIWDTHIIQSYYAHYKIDGSLITNQLRKAFNEISQAGSYQKVTQSQKYPNGIKNEKTHNLKVYYWVPQKN